jgi:Transmembrane domain of unknown function (DUF3566)
MKAVVSTAETGARSEESRLAPRQTKVVVRRIHPWSVFKFSLLFYFCLMLVLVFALVILYEVLSVLGVLDSLAHLLQTSGFGSPKTGFHFNGPWIFTRVFLVGVAGVVVWSVVNLFVTLLYNLVADVVGGVQITLGERR